MQAVQIPDDKVGHFEGVQDFIQDISLVKKKKKQKVWKKKRLLCKF